MTSIAALRCDAITAPCAFDQYLNGQNFSVGQPLQPPRLDIVGADADLRQAGGDALDHAGARALFQVDLDRGVIDRYRCAGTTS